MYVCLCNAISDTQVRARACQGRCSVSDVYRHHGCQAQCGKCSQSILEILREFAAENPAVGGFAEGAVAAPSE